jgi:hypothetical protein
MAACFVGCVTGGPLRGVATAAATGGDDGGDGGDAATGGGATEGSAEVLGSGAARTLAEGAAVATSAAGWAEGCAVALGGGGLAAALGGGGLGGASVATVGVIVVILLADGVAASPEVFALVARQAAATQITNARPIAAPT